MKNRIVALIVLLIMIISSHEFVLSDTLKDTKESMGNTNGNSGNWGYVAQSGDWIYYVVKSNTEKNIGYEKSTLYKEKKDGTKKKVVTTGKYIYSVNIVGDWIYYLADFNDKKFHQSYAIYKIKSDGTKKTKISKDKEEARFINIKGDWIYYDNWLDHENLYKMKLDGTNKMKICDTDSLWNINLNGNTVFFSGHGIYSIDTNGDNKKEVSNVLRDIIVAEDWIYGVKSEKGIKYICKIKTDGTQETVLKELNGYNKYYDIRYNTDGEWVYYYDADKRTLSKIKTDGTNDTDLLKIEVNKEANLQEILLTDEWIYYTLFEEFTPVSGKNSLYKVKKDGSKNILIS